MTEAETQPEGPSELETLKQRADLMGIKYHPNIGVKKLRGLVNSQLTPKTENVVEDEPEETIQVLVEKEVKKAVKKAEKTGEPREETKAERKQRELLQMKIRNKRATALVRIRLTCMNPNKADWNGEILTVQNRTVGTIRKYVPFNAENGWHVPQMLLTVLQNKECQVFHTVKRNGVNVRQGKMVKEFAIELLPDLTQKEIDIIATRQAAQGVMDD